MCEVCWTYSLKLMTFKDLKLLRFNNFYSNKGLHILLPFIGYIVFGIGNIVCFSKAIKVVPTPTAFAVWTASTLIMIKLVDTFFNHQKTSMVEIVFLMMITVGIIGLKFYGVPSTE